MHMKRANILAVAALAMVSVCSNAIADYTYEPSREKVERLSLQDARRLIESVVIETQPHTSCWFQRIPRGPEDRQISGKRISFTPGYIVLGEASDYKGIPPESQLRFYYRDFPPVRLSYETDFSSAWDHLNIHLNTRNKGVPYTHLFCGVKRGSPWFQDGAQHIADAFLRLQLEFERMNSPATEAAFESAAQNYRNAQMKPQLPEEAVKFKVQAELAIQQKRFDDAVDLYDKALGIAPWWPAGHFNRGLILGELQDYQEGIRSMQKYLKLEPDASNARAVQLKIYEWEGMK